jgi:acid phosphatase
MLMRRDGRWYVDSGACTTCQEALEPLLVKHRVDVAYFGHVHNMQRLGPLANNTKDPRGYNNPSAPVYLVNGAAGESSFVPPSHRIFGGY